MTGRSGTRSRNQTTPRSMRGIRSPATTMTSKCGRAASAGKSQPRVNSTCRSDKIQSNTSVLIFPVFFGPTLHRLDEWVIVRRFLDADHELHVDRIAERTREAFRVVDEGALLAARAAAKLGHGATLLRR